jgi:transcriptional regulator with XRE-family HTH domain
MTQLAIPIEVNPAEVARKPSMGAAIALCAELAGLEPKQIQGKLGMDKGQWSRWESGQEGVIWPKFSALMDVCGNDAPMFWMLHQRGYDMHSIRKLETETERENRKLREENAALRRVIKAGGI